jgi:hypothetical protein
MSTTSATGRGRGVPAYIVLRGQRFGGAFGDPIGAGRGFDSGAGGNIPYFPNNVGSTLFGGGVSPRTAREYGSLLGPFKAGVPTIATIIAEIVDEFGNLVSTAPATTASLVIRNATFQNPFLNQITEKWRNNPNGAALWQAVRSSNAYSEAYLATSASGRFEWKDVVIEGIASTRVTLSLRHDIGVEQRFGQGTAIEIISFPVRSSLSTLATCACPMQVSLQGGLPFAETFATQRINLDTQLRLYPGAEGPFAVPGVIGGIPSYGDTAIGGYSGSAQYIVVGEKVRFAHKGRGTYSAIALIIKDRYGNMSSFPVTSATISINGGRPPVDQIRTPIIGNITTSTVAWGLGDLGQEGLNMATSANLAQVALNVAIFHELTILGATASNCSLSGTACRYFSDSDCDRTIPLPPFSWDRLLSEPSGGTSAIVSLMPARAVSIAPLLIPDPYNRNLPDRMPSQMVIGASNNADPRTWFYAQAVDEFGNRVDRGPYEYNGGEARISFATPEQGLPASNDGTFQFKPESRDPYIKANTQTYSARGTSSRAVGGLYTFKDFVPLGPASRRAGDVVLTLEDTALKGVRAPFDTKTARPLFQPIPPITTATTTFTMPTSVRLSGNAHETTRLVLAPNPLLNAHEQATVSFSVPSAMRVRIEVLSVQGARMLALERDVQAGNVVEMLTTENLSSGTYFVRVLLGGQFVETAMMTVVR